jgi:poly(3-hydroxybutyrate) depolymerase
MSFNVNSREWPLPFWRNGQGYVLSWGQGMENVCFEAVLVEPMLNSLGSPENLPLMVYFAGLTAKGSKAMKEINPKKLAKITPGPFVLVTPHQFDGHWWTISPRWGDGDFQPDIATRLVSWIKYLANFPGIDCNKVSLLGFSAGAYAATELLACRREVRFDCVVLGGVHGHGQSLISKANHE